MALTTTNFGIESKAILVHHHIKNNAIDLVCHDVIPTPNGGYTLGAGRVFGLPQQMELVNIISRANAPTLQILPENVLVQHTNLLVWWMPAHKNDMVIKSDSGFQHLMVNYPPLVFMAYGDSLHVAALTKNKRPQYDTALFYAPVMCQDSRLEICTGNMSMPLRPTVANMKEYESFFFEGANTHLNQQTIKGIDAEQAFYEFYKELGDKPFPKSKLVSSNWTLNKMIDSILGDRHDY